MKRITNINDPNNVIIVSDAYINGDRIVCITEEEEFDLWRNCWKLEGLPERPEGLEEAAWDCVLDSIDVNNPVLLPKYKELLTYLFIAGAEWMKSKYEK